MVMPVRTIEFAAVIALLCTFPIAGQAQQPAPAPSASPVSLDSTPGAAEEKFARLKAQCEAAGCGKGNGDVCVDAAEMLLADDPSEVYHDMDKTKRTKVALRLLERGVDNSNRARAKAYDLYAEGGILSGLSNFNSDQFRADELLDMMLKSGYPGGILRKMKLGLGFFGTEKEAICKEAKAMLAKGGLDADSTRIAREIGNSLSCSQDKQ
jgi:hypothetical protein